MKKQYNINTFLICFSLIALSVTTNAQNIAILKYNGGGDWYSNPTALPNLIAFCNTNIQTHINTTPETVDVGSTDIFQYPLLHMTGHGNVVFSTSEAENLKSYLLSGGFLHIDDNYGMKPYVTKALKTVFPNKELLEIPKTHAIFNQVFSFKNGLPKIHEHNGKAPQAFGIFNDNRLLVLFTYESDLGDGWEDQAVHNDPEDIREKALQMGANIISYAFEH